MSGENAQLSAHVHLLESELEAAQQHEGQHPGSMDSTDVTPRSQQQHFAFHEEQGAGAMHEQDTQQNGSAPAAEGVSPLRQCFGTPPDAHVSS